jgi:hypothetical protein
MAAKKTDISVEEKLEALYQLQKIDSKIDRIRFVKGELPLEVQDMEDEIEGLNTRVSNITAEIDANDALIAEKNRIKDETKVLIQKLEKQQNSVKNNREFDSLNKEIELAKLEIELCDKKNRDFNEKKISMNARLKESTDILDIKKTELDIKKTELGQIEAETNAELNELMKERDQAKGHVDERILIGYEKIRSNYKNGLAVVTIDRDSCGGCFAKIPPQRQLEIKQRKKVMVCENCGRIYAYPKDKEMEDSQKLMEETPKPTRSRSKRVKE